MKSVRKRIVFNIFVVIVLAVVLLEIFIVTILKNSLYNNVRRSLLSEIRYSSGIYTNYCSNNTLEDNVINNVDIFWNQTDAQVQIWSTYGELIKDSLGDMPSDNMVFSDVAEALKGNTSYWQGRLSYSDDNLLAVSTPLISNNEIVGVLRFISSLKSADDSLRSITLVLLIVGFASMFVSLFVGFIISQGIVNQIKEITDVAHKMAQGNFKIRSKKRNNDEIGKLSDTLNYMAEQIQQNEKLKNEFISSVSHELRTPLTSIKGWAITIKGDDMENSNIFNDGLTIIENECDRLSAMVEELLDFSRFTAGKITLNMDVFDVCRLFKDLHLQMKPRADREKKFLELYIYEELGDFTSDQNRLRQIVVNILDNSLRFTEAGGIIDIYVKKTNKYLEITISDDGIGISQEDLLHVKEKFFKGKNSKSQSGIGLSVCDEIIKLMDGEFIIESELGKGTKNIVRLPYKNI